MARDNGQGMFSMEFINECVSIRDIAALKAKVTAHIDVSGATDANKQKAMRMVHNARTVNNLIFGMSNFSLAHQGLKVN